jgi:STAM-binding protein
LPAPPPPLSGRDSHFRPLPSQTHPSQTNFLSAVDLHTSCGFQLTLAEAIAIVVAPRDAGTPVAVYRLTDDDGGGGLTLIQACDRRGFHPHPDGRIYEQCGHVRWMDDSNGRAEIIDMR